MHGALYQMWCKHLFEVAQVFWNTVEQILKIFYVDIFHIIVGTEFCFNRIDTGTRHLPLIEALHGVMASHTSGSSRCTLIGRCALGIIHEHLPEKKQTAK